MRNEVGSHLFVQAVIAALVEEVEILVGEELWDGESGFRAHEVSFARAFSVPEKVRRAWEHTVERNPYMLD